MTSNFELFQRKKNDLYLTEIIRTYWIHILDEYRDEKYTPYSDGFYFWPDWQYQYLNELQLGEAIGSSYLTWKS